MKRPLSKENKTESNPKRIKINNLQFNQKDNIINSNMLIDFSKLNYF